MGSFGIVGISSQANGSANVQIQIFFLAKAAYPQILQQAPRHHQRRLFPGLGQQDDKFISAIAEGIVDQPQLRLDQISDLRQQLASNQVSVRVVHLLEVVKIDEEDGEFIVETRRAIDFRFQRLVKVARVVEASAIVRDGEFLDFLYRARVLDGDRGKVAQRLQEELLLREAIHIYVHQL